MRAFQIVTVAAIFGGLTGAALAQAQTDVASAKKDEVKVLWDKYPSGSEALTYYPQKALNEQKSGAAWVECTFNDPLPGETSVAITACEVLEEYPQSMGFGAATAEIIRRYSRAKALPGEDLKAGKIKIKYKWVLDGRPLVPESESIAFEAGTNPDDYYPKDSKKSAHIKLRCAYKVGEDLVGDITDCAVLGEKPKSAGLGEAAATLFQAKGRVVFGGSTLLIPPDGEITFGFDWSPSKGR